MTRELVRSPIGAVRVLAPDGIPPAIILNKADHRAPFPGDHGVRFSPRPAPTGEQG